MIDTGLKQEGVSVRMPHLDDRPFLTDGGLETTLVFLDGIDLPHFAAFDLLRRRGGKDRLIEYYETYLRIAQSAEMGFILESATWRASPDWAARMGISLGELDRVNGDAISLLHELRVRYQSADYPIVVSGCVGPRGDGYDPDIVMTVDAAQTYHSRQIGVFAQSGVDVVTAVTMTNVPEAIGIARAAKAVGLPVVISFTLETDGCLPTGDNLGSAIARVDAETAAAPAYYMINCAHPSHFRSNLEEGGSWVSRIGAIRANASRRSHAELDEATELDRGNPNELADDYHALLKQHPNIRVIGGCCGTDHHHIAEIADRIR